MRNAPTAVVLGGQTGLLGQSLSEVLLAEGWTVFSPGGHELDLFDSGAVADFLEKTGATILFNTIAYTSVDLAEKEQDEAFRLNRYLPGLLGESCRKVGCSLVHYSTDFVFSGSKETPYTPEDEPDPRCIYGKSKLAGERVLLDIGLEKLLIIRTAWLFGPYKTNFVDKILSLANEKDSLRVVHDQIGSPTYTTDLALHSLQLANAGCRGVFHVVNRGSATWCELAAEAVSCAGENCLVQAVTSEEFPQDAVRPPYSVLDVGRFEEVTGVTPRSWLSALREYCFRRSEEKGPRQSS